MKTILAVILCLLASVTTARAQTNPCTVPQGLVANPTRVAIEIADYTASMPDGRQVTDSYVLSFHAAGTDPNSSPILHGPVTMPKTAFTLVAGTTNCYRADIASPPPPRTAGYVLGVRGRRASAPNDPETVSTATGSNPFFNPPPANPVAAVRVQ